MKKLILSLTLIIGLSISYQTSQAEPFLFKKKKVQTEVKDSVKKKAPLTKYDKLFKGKSNHTVAESEFMKLHKLGNKIYFEMPKSLMGRDMLLASTTTKTSDNTVSTNGYKARTPMHIRFTSNDSIVYMHKVNALVSYDKADQRIEKLVDINYGDPIIEKYEVKAVSNDSTSLVFDVTNLFLGSNESLSPISPSAYPVSIKAKNTSSLSHIEEIKAFDDNISVRTQLSYKVSLNLLLRNIYTDRPVSITATRTLLLLPEEPMRERISDSRVGIFLTNKKEISNKEDQLKSYSIANRWKLEPKDVEAYKRGELTDPVKPIVFYMDNLFPESWKGPLREGILRWNKAFEEIGFSNAVQVLDFPVDDPDFDPDNLKYSCIRYVPSTTVNAMGPSWTDPRSGEIINASVLIYNDITIGLNNWRFVQTAAIDPRVRSKVMSDEIRDESLAYVIAHEVGHCLGLMHNMSASAAYSVDSLRSASFTQKYGTTPSIMDYARFNYIAQRGDENVALLPPDLGVYDKYAIKWAYEYFPELNTAEQEAKVLEQMVDEKVGDPLYRYGKQQIASRYDPSALEEDLGDDPIKAANYGIKNLKYILDHLDEWIDDDDDFSRRQELHKQIAMQYNRYLNNVLYNIGGIYLNEAKDGTPAKRFEPVSREKQKASLTWLVNQIRTNEWLDKPSLKNKESLSVGYAPLINTAISQSLAKIFMNVVLSSYVADKNPYLMNEYFNDLYAAVWQPLIKNQALTNGDKLLQDFMVRIAAYMSSTMGVRRIGFASDDSLISFGSAYAPSTEEIVLYGLDDTGLVEKYQQELKSIEQEKGSEWLLAERQKQFGYGYGWQAAVNASAIDESPAYYYDYLCKSRDLLKARTRYARATDRAHYNKMLFAINYALSSPTLD